MKQKSIIIMLVLAIWLSACAQGISVPQDNRVTVIGSGVIVSRELELSGFDRVEAGLTFDVTIRQDNEFRVVIYADENFIDYLLVEVQGTTLTMGFQPGYAYDVDVTLRVEITMPELAGVRMNASARVTLDSFRVAQHFEAELAGASVLVGELDADSVAIAANGNSYVALQGSARTLEIALCGNSVLELDDFHVAEAVHQAGCAGSIERTMFGRLDLDAGRTCRATILPIGSSAIQLRLDLPPSTPDYGRTI